MNVLILSWNYPPAIGGIEYVVANLAEGLAGRGHRVGVMTRGGDGGGDSDYVRRAPRPGLMGFLRFLWRDGGRRCRADRPDIVVCGTVVPAPVAWFFRMRFGCPFVVLVHGSDVLQRNPVVRFGIRFLYRRADQLTANSTPTRELLRQAGMRDDKVTTVFPGVRVQDYATRSDRGAEPWLDRLGDRPLLLAVGRLIRRKGFLELVEQAMPKLIERHPDLALVIVGGDATESLVHGERMSGSIRAAIEAAGLGNHVWLAGPLPDEDVIRLFFRASLFVMPCLDLPGDVEGFGIVFLEAALAGCPSVATRVGGIPDAVIDGETGVLVAPGDWPAIVDTISVLLADDEWRQRLGQQAGDRARASFSWDAITADYEAVLRRACE